MAKQLNVNLAVTANTQQAKAALNELNKSLSNVLQAKSITINDESINHAKQAAMDLKRHLDAAMDVNTGKLDLSKFSASLTKSGQSLQGLHRDLSKIGPEGQSAFLALSKSIASADASALTLGNKLGGLLTTLKNTARWQISSSILHGFMGTLQGAYGYAQDLNESLNNIRIVTGQNTNQMAEFAKQANEAAKALSTTTTKYTDAALIYYQQGLSGKEVTDRVNTTIKLANVSRQSAEEVSSQMTAIWNNFADGSKNLEYYADVITKLGAATAASSSEISDGIQKFAAVADTVGLSYEKATAALATVVAETRQSADVVGTAFKTMFARFQGLELGETLEDGVTLNKYAEAINTVGVNILEANGDLKDMDTILDELGEKWNTIGQAQKVALAETVAGTRQYAQFMAIMENYDKILANQNLAAGAEGTLQKQADIYGESWEAASKRVRAALEEVYNQLLNDKFFITLLSGAEKTVGIISDVIDGLGGIKGMLLLIGSIVLNKYAKEMPAFFEKIIQNISILTGKAEQSRQSMLSQNLQIVNSMKGGTSSQEVSAQIDTMSKVSEMTLKLAQNRQRLSQAEIENYENKIKEVQIYGEVAAAIGKEVDQLNKESAAMRSGIRNDLQGVSNYGKINLNKFEDEDQQVISGATDRILSSNKDYQDLLQAKEEAKEALQYAQQLGSHAGIKKAQQELDKINTQINVIISNVTGKDLLSGLEQSAKKLGKAENILSTIAEKTAIWNDQIKQLDANDQGIQDITDSMQTYIQQAEEAGLDTTELKGALDELHTGGMSIEDVVKVFQDFAMQDLTPLEEDVEQFQAAIVALGGNSSALEVYVAKLKEGASAEQALAAAKDFLNQKTDEEMVKTLQLSEAMGRLAGAATQVVMIINAFKNIGNIINNDDLTDGEKLLQIATSATMILPNLINLLNAEKLASLSTAAARILGIKSIESETRAHWLSVPAKTAAGTAGWVALGPLLLFVGIAAGAIALIYALAKAIETPAEKLKRLNEEQKKLEEGAQKAKEAWEDFQNTFSNYESCLDSLQKLTAGTDEFNEKLKEVNENAQNIAKSLQLVFGKDYVLGKNGEYLFTDEGLKTIELISAGIQEGQSVLDWNVLSSNRKKEEYEYQLENRNTKVDQDLLYNIQEQGYTDFFTDLQKSAGFTENLYNVLFDKVEGILESSEAYDKYTGYLNTSKIDTEYLIQELTKHLSQSSLAEDENFDANSFATGLADSYIKLFGWSNNITNPIITNQDFSKEANIVASQLDLNNPYANMAAQAAFSNQQKVRDIYGQATVTQEEAEKEWHNLGYDILSQDIQDQILSGLTKEQFITNKNIKDSFTAEANKILEIVGNQAATISTNQNKDSIQKILSGNTTQISPEELQRLANGGLSLNDKNIAAAMYKQLYPTAEQTFEEIFNDFLANYNAADYYRSQVKSIDEIREAIKNYNKELKSLKLGDVLSPEVYETLSEGAKTYFALMEDGTYKLIGNAQQLQDILFKEATADFDTNLQVLSNIDSDSLTPEDSAKIQENAISYAMATETLEQLNYVKQRFNELGIDTETQVLAENSALQDLATKYESCTDDLEAYQHALATENQQLVANAKATLEYSIRVAELAEKHGFDAKETEAYAKRLKNHLANSYKDANFSVQQLEKAALKAAISNQRLDRGLSSLNKNLETYKKSLTNADRNSIEWSNTMDALKTDLADIVDMDVSVITDDFAEKLLTNAEYSGLLTQALDGNVEAIKRLREIAAEEMILNIKSNLAEAGEDAEDFMTLWEQLKEKMGETLEAGDIDQTELINAFNELIAKGHMTKDEIEAALSGLHVAADIETQYHEQQMQVPTTVTETYSEPGGDIPYEYVDEQGNKQTGTYKTWRRITATYEGPPVTVTGYVPTYSIKGTTGSGSSSSKVVSGGLPPTSGKAKSNPSFNARFIDDQGNTATPFTQTATEPSITRGFEPVKDEDIIVPSYGSTTTGINENANKDKGGSSEKEKTRAAELIEDEEHRYDELNKTLEGLTQQFERLGKARERAWGKNKITLLEQEITKLKQMQQVYERYLKTVAGDDWNNLSKVLQSGGNLGAIIASGKAGGNLQKDFNKLVSSVVGAIQYKVKDEKGNEARKVEDWRGLKDVLGIDLMLDEFGQIANRDEIEEAIESWWNKSVEDWNKMTADEQQENSSYWDQLSAIKEYMQKLLNQYDESINTFVEQSDKLLDNLYEQQAKVYEHFRYKVDLKVEISERSLKRIEYAIKVLGDNIYKVPEVMRSWFDKRVTDTKAEVINQGSTWASAYQEASALYSSGQISQEDYVQTIKDAQDGLYGCVDALLEINEEMREYYKNVLSHVKDEMSRITNEMDHQLNTVTHLANVLSLLGRETDYEAMGKILDAQLQMSRNGYEVSKAQTEMYRRQYEAAQADLQDLMASGVSEAALEEWKNAVLYPAKEALLEAEAEMEADFEAYLQVVNAIYENKINKIYQDSERRLSGAWGSFDELNNAMERQRALEDEYLTKTNQIYETNVLLKKLAQDIDKTNNDAAKIKIKNFSDEIEGLQQKNKLSKSELDIAKARYEVLLAEIALEDARNAKSTVRLQRDNEGNYGYVYTADSDNIAAAEDDLAKKNNDLYNLVLGQANNYTEKILQLTQERNAALKELDMAWAEGRIADEETYNKLREDINNKYNSLIQEDYESYYRALYWLDETAATDHTEAWGTSFQDILDASEDFERETDTLMHETGEAIDWLSGIRAEATEEAKVGAGDLEEQLKDLTTANDELTKTMLEEVIPASEEALDMAQKLTDEWIRQYDEIMALIDAYLALIDAMNAALKEMAGVEEMEEFDPTKDYSQAATEKYFAAGGVITKEVLQDLMYRVQKEDLNGGHNDKWATESQILQLMDMASSGDTQAAGFLADIMGYNGEQKYYTSENMSAMGITGEGYSLEDFAAKLDETNSIIDQLKSSLDESKQQDEEVADAAAEQTDAATDSATSIGDSAEKVVEGLTTTEEQFKTDVDEAEQIRAENEQELAEETADRIENITMDLIDALHNNADIVSMAVQAAADVISASISAAAAYAAEAQAAAAAIAGTDKFDTGGYTGSWGSGGKLAILHQKELVLNSADTENILAAVGLLRDFSSAIDFRAAASSVSTGLNSPSYQTGSQTLEQSVTIHAEFPNATNHSEIEEAFNNLINRASQYANRS